MIKKELPMFVVVGIITVIIDFIVYNVLVEFRLSDVNVAKGVGFVSGTIFSYFMHRIWTFGHISNLAQNNAQFPTQKGSKAISEII